MTVKVLKATNETLQVVLSSAVTTNELQCSAHYADDTGVTFVESSNFVTTNGTTAVTLVDAPATNTRRLIRSLTIYNNDTINQTVTVQIDVGGTPTILYNYPLPVGMTLHLDGAVTGQENTSNLITSAESTQNGDFVVASTVYSTALSLSPGTSFQSGNYRICWAASVQRQSSSGKIKLRLQIDDVTVFELQDLDPTHWIHQSSFNMTNWATDTHTVTLQIASTKAGKSVYMKNGIISAIREGD